MSRSTVLLLTMLIPLAALAGCLTSDDEGESESNGPDDDAGDPGAQDNGNGGNGTGPEGNGTSGLAVLTGNVTMSAGNGTGDEGNGTGDEGNGTGDEGNGTGDEGNGSAEAEAVADANLTLVQEGGEGNASLETTTDADGGYRFEDVEPGAYTLKVEAECCEMENLSVALEAGVDMTADVQLVPLDLGPAPEGGTAAGNSAGVMVLTSGALGNERASFEVSDETHTQIELVPEFSDPEAQDGSSYSLRVYLPDGEEENHDATNGEPIAVGTLMKGTYEINIWPASLAGSYDYEVEWCVYTDVHCNE